ILLRCRGRKSAAWNCARNKCGTQEHCKCRTVQFFHETSFLSKCFDLRESLGPQQAIGAGAAPLPAGGGRDRLDGLPSFERFPKIKNPIKEFQAERSISDRKSTRLNSSHVSISYAVFCLKKK